MDRIEKLRSFLKKNPHDSFIAHALALELIKKGNELAARELFIQLLEKDETYIGSYYHLAKLFERLNEKEKAIEYYEKGMKIARELKDHHSYSELHNAYEELIDI